MSEKDKELLEALKSLNTKVFLIEQKITFIEEKHKLLENLVLDLAKL